MAETCPGCGEEPVPPQRWHWECPTCGHYIERTGPGCEDGGVE